MPIPSPNDGESHDEFMGRCMGDDVMNEEYPDEDQRYAVCQTAWGDRSTGAQPRHAALREVRSFRCDELRATKEGRLVGHAAVYNTKSQYLGWFFEVVEPGAFDRALNGTDEVRALVEHDPSKIIGKTPTTLKLTEDNRGLKVNIDVAQTSSGRDILESVRRGDVDSMSFGFIELDGFWDKDEDGVDVRHLKSVQLFDVSPVAYPAYTQTDIAVRSHAAWAANRKWEPNAITRAYVERAERLKRKFAIT